MERVLLDELMVQHRRKTGEKPTLREVADHVFTGEVNTRKNKTGEDISPKRRLQLLRNWDNGCNLSALKPRHIMRLAAFFGVTDVNELLSVQP